MLEFILTIGGLIGLMVCIIAFVESLRKPVKPPVISEMDDIAAKRVVDLYRTYFSFATSEGAAVLALATVLAAKDLQPTTKLDLLA